MQRLIWYMAKMFMQRYNIKNVYGIYNVLNKT